MSSLRSQEADTLPSGRRRRCYGAAVEAALAHVTLHQASPPTARRLQELLSQLDADGHDTAALRDELGQLLDAAGMGLPALRTEPPPVLPAPQIPAREGQHTHAPEASMLPGNWSLRSVAASPDTPRHRVP